MPLARCSHVCPSDAKTGLSMMSCVIGHRNCGGGCAATGTDTVITSSGAGAASTCSAWMDAYTMPAMQCWQRLRSRSTGTRLQDQTALPIAASIWKIYPQCKFGLGVSAALHCVDCSEQPNLAQHVTGYTRNFMVMPAHAACCLCLQPCSPVCWTAPHWMQQLAVGLYTSLMLPLPG